jgi:hypothetical protein
MPKRNAEYAGRRRLPARWPSRAIIVPAHISKDPLGQWHSTFTSSFGQDGASGRVLEH